jgi:hypothetical protein
MKHLITGCLILFTCLSLLFSQIKYRIPESIIAVKIGYHTAYTSDEGTAVISSANIPHGFCTDITAEVHSGKNWYIGFNYDLSFGNETAYDPYSQKNVENSFTIHHYSPIVKYRFPIKKGFIYSAIGIGGSKVYAKRSGSDALAMINLRVGGEYYLSKWALFSLETVYIGAAEISIESGRNYRFFQFKTGITFVLK